MERLLPSGMSDEEDEGAIKRSRTPPKRLPAMGNKKLKEQINSIWNMQKQITRLHKLVHENTDMESARALLQQGVSVDSSLGRDWTLLMKACSKGDFENVQELIDLGADPNHRKELFSPLMACCISGKEPEESRLRCLRLLISNGADVNAQDRHKSTALIEASYYGWKRLVTELVNTPGIDLDTQDKEGWTALHYAVAKENMQVVRILVSAGANAEVKDFRQSLTPIGLAESRNLLEILEIFQVEPSPAVVPEWPEVEERRDGLQDFLSELPDDEGNGGFYSDVKSIFVGVGAASLHDKLKTIPSLTDFLNMTDEDLLEIGVKFSPARRKILSEGIHRYHLHPFKKSSLLRLSRNMMLSADMTVNTVATILKHLCILRSTLSCLKRRFAERIKTGQPFQDRVDELATLSGTLVELHVEIKKLRNVIMHLEKEVDRIKTSDSTEADHVSKEVCSEKGVWRKYAGTLISSIVITWSIYYWRCR